MIIYNERLVFSFQVLLIALTGVGYTFASPGYKVYRRVNLDTSPSPRIYAVPAYKLGYKFNKDNLYRYGSGSAPYDSSFLKELFQRSPIEAFGQPGRTVVQIQPQVMRNVKDDPILNFIPHQYPSVPSDPFIDQQLQTQLQQQQLQSQLQQQLQAQLQQQQLQSQLQQQPLQTQQSQPKSATEAPEQYNSPYSVTDAPERNYLYNYPQQNNNKNDNKNNEDEYTITISVKSSSGSADILPAFEMKTNSLPVKIEEIENTLLKLADTFLNQYNLKNGEKSPDVYEKSNTDLKYDSYGVPITGKELGTGIAQTDSFSQTPFDYNTYNQLSYTNNNNYYDYLNELYKINGK